MHNNLAQMSNNNNNDSDGRQDAVLALYCRL